MVLGLILVTLRIISISDFIYINYKIIFLLFLLSIVFCYRAQNIQLRPCLVVLDVKGLRTSVSVMNFL